MRVSCADVLGSSSNIGMHAPLSCRVQEDSAQKPSAMAVTGGHSYGGVDHCGIVCVQERSTGDKLWCANALVQTSPSGKHPVALCCMSLQVLRNLPYCTAYDWSAILT